VVGRKDSQIKVRGHRIEVNEIESKLMEMEGIQEVAVTTSDDTHEDKQLVAYVAAQNQGLRPTASALRDYLGSALPEYMIPSAFVILEKLPLTPNGKVDHGALPPPEASRPELDTPFVAPRTFVETQLAQIWAEVLSLDHVGIHDSFFELGGHSLAATQVISRVRNTFRVRLPFKTLFDGPTVAHMAEVIGRYQNHRAEHGRQVETTSDYSSPELVKGHRVTPTDPFIECRKEEIEPSMPRRFEQVAARYPDRPAVKTKSRSNH
jgi:acyl carrier protein